MGLSGSCSDWVAPRCERRAESSRGDLPTGHHRCTGARNRADSLPSPRELGSGTLNGVAELKTEQIIALLIPIIVIQLGLMVAALYDLEHEERRVRGGNKLVWVLVIVFLNVIGPIIYFVAGREEA